MKGPAPSLRPAPGRAHAPPGPRPGAGTPHTIEEGIQVPVPQSIKAKAPPPLAPPSPGSHPPKPAPVMMLEALLIVLSCFRLHTLRQVTGETVGADPEVDCGADSSKISPRDSSLGSQSSSSWEPPSLQGAPSSHALSQHPPFTHWSSCDPPSFTQPCLHLSPLFPSPLPGLV